MQKKDKSGDRRINGSNTDGRDARGRFAKGNPGKRQGARNKATQTIEALMAEDLETVTRAVIEQATAGNVAAAKLVLDRLCPPRRDRPLDVCLPICKEKQDALATSAALLDGIASGDVSPSDAAAIVGVIQAHVKLLETIDFDQRLQRIEETFNGKTPCRASDEGRKDCRIKHQNL